MAARLAGFVLARFPRFSRFVRSAAFAGRLLPFARLLGLTRVLARLAAGLVSVHGGLAGPMRVVMSGFCKPALVTIPINDMRAVFSRPFAGVLRVLATATLEISVCRSCVLSGAAATAAPPATPTASPTA